MAEGVNAVEIMLKRRLAHQRDRGLTRHCSRLQPVERREMPDAASPASS